MRFYSGLLKNKVGILQKLCFALILLVLTNPVTAQDYRKEIGSLYKHLNELPSFKNCVILESRVNDCDLACKKVVDTLNRELLLVAEQRMDGQENYRKLLDVLQVWADYPEYMTLIGSLETKDGQKSSAFLIAVESDTAKLDSSDVPPVVATKSIHIFEAWQLNCRRKKFRKFPVKNLYRVHQGYYVEQPPSEAEIIRLY